MPECYIRGSTIKYLRIPDEVIDMVKEEVIQKSKFVVKVVEEEVLKEGEEEEVILFELFITLINFTLSGLKYWN